jgi:hypothetical protein
VSDDHGQQDLNTPTQFAALGHRQGYLPQPAVSGAQEVGMEGMFQLEGDQSRAASSVGRARRSSRQASVNSAASTPADRDPVRASSDLTRLAPTSSMTSPETSFLSLDSTPQATDRGFAFAVKLPGVGWRSEADLSSIGQDLVTELLRNISGSATRVTAWQRLGPSANACILTRVIARTEKGSFGNISSATDACQKCIGASAGARGRKSDPRPCAGLIELNGELTIGFLPLPERLREGKESSDLGFWIHGEGV